jgi:hypothetical protein
MTVRAEQDALGKLGSGLLDGVVQEHLARIPQFVPTVMKIEHRTVKRSSTIGASGTEHLDRCVL